MNPRRQIQLLSALTALVAVLTAVAGCSDQRAGNKTNTALEQEYSLAVYGVPPEKAPRGDYATRQDAAKMAKATCDFLRLASVSTQPDDPKNKDILARAELNFARKLAFTPKKTRQMMQVSTKHNCPEFSATLQAYDQANPL